MAVDGGVEKGKRRLGKILREKSLYLQLEKCVMLISVKQKQKPNLCYLEQVSC